MRFSDHDVSMGRCQTPPSRKELAKTLKEASVNVILGPIPATFPYYLIQEYFQRKVNYHGHADILALT